MYSRRDTYREFMLRKKAAQQETLNENNPQAPWWIRLLAKYDDRHYPESYDKVKIHV